MQIEPSTASQHFRGDLLSFPPLGLASWAAALAEMIHATSTAGDAPALEDLRQLKGLCDRMEEGGFLPLRVEELTGNLARRIEDYCGLADDLTSMLVGEELADIRGFNATSRRGSYIRSLRLKGNSAQVTWSSEWWTKVYPTPLRSDLNLLRGSCDSSVGRSDERDVQQFGRSTFRFLAASVISCPRLWSRRPPGATSLAHARNNARPCADAARAAEARRMFIVRGRTFPTPETKSFRASGINGSTLFTYLFSSLHKRPDPSSKGGL
jgi:hypothetical protein